VTSIEEDNGALSSWNSKLQKGTSVMMNFEKENEWIRLPPRDKSVSLPPKGGDRIHLRSQLSMKVMIFASEATSNLLIFEASG
jgi:hypothetical protein